MRWEISRQPKTKKRFMEHENNYSEALTTKEDLNKTEDLSK